MTPTLPIEEHVRKKILEPDFRGAHADGRLCMARVLAQKGRVDDVISWFEQARRERREFERIGMSGWLRRAETLRGTGSRLG